MEIVQKYTLDFHDILKKFNTIPPSIEPTASGHIVEQIESIKQIISSGFAYEKNGSVYFDITEFNKSNSYGKLSGRKIEEMMNNSRSLDGSSDKKSPQDFALWKKADKNHIMNWESPWGKGFPGWHLECTSMSKKYLGNFFDIHGGGIDLKFPHHDCEIAQSEVINGCNPARFWMHTNMLTLNGKKMSKSLDNHVLPAQIFNGQNKIFDKSFNPNVVKFFIYQAHYRSVLDLSNDALVASEKGFHKVIDAINILESFKNFSEETNFDIDKWSKRCYNAMNDDFNTPILIANIFEAVKFINKVNIGKAELSEKGSEELLHYFNSFVFDIMGLKKSDQSIKQNNKLDKVMNIILELRNDARTNKDYNTSDKIRDLLKENGISINDNNKDSSYNID